MQTARGQSTGVRLDGWPGLNFLGVAQIQWHFFGMGQIIGHHKGGANDQPSREVYDEA